MSRTDQSLRVGNIDLGLLRVPMNCLYYLESLEDFSGLSDWDLSAIDEHYSVAEIARLIQALEWAKANPDFAFSALLPRLRFSDQEVYSFLCIVLAQIQGRHEMKR